MCLVHYSLATQIVIRITHQSIRTSSYTLYGICCFDSTLLKIYEFLYFSARFLLDGLHYHDCKRQSLCHLKYFKGNSIDVVPSLKPARCGMGFLCAIFGSSEWSTCSAKEYRFFFKGSELLINFLWDCEIIIYQYTTRDLILLSRFTLWIWCMLWISLSCLSKNRATYSV